MRKRFLRLAFISLLVSLAVVWVLAVDSDDDGMSDAYELFFGLNVNSNDAALNYDDDTLSNYEESLLWTDPFAGDTDRDGWLDCFDLVPVSRAFVPWGNPQFTSTNNMVTYTWPSWMISAWAVDGSFQTSSPFAWLSSSLDGDDVGSLNMDVDRSIITSNLVLKLDFYDHTNSSMYIDLYDTNEVITATNLYGNLNTGLDSNVSRIIEIPFADYNSAVGIHLRKGAGAMTIYRSLLYIDADLDGLDADQEAQLGTSDNNPDSDGDGLSDYDEVFIYGTDPTKADTDGDGLTDYQEIFIYNTNPLLRDTDGDGVSDALEVSMGKDPVVSNSYTRLPFTEYFETNTVSIGDIAGQNNWEASHTNAALVQTNTVYEGAQALYMSYSGEEPVNIDHIFADESSIVWVDFMTRAIAVAIPTNDLTVAAAAAFNSDGYVIASDGARPANDRFLVVTNAGPFNEDEWVRLSLRLDYTAQEWLLCVNGVKVAEGLDFLGNHDRLTKMSLTGNRTALDKVQIGHSQPAGLSIDGDTLPDDWELQYFADLEEIDEGDPDNDGLTNLQEYQAGTNPNNPDTDGDGFSDGHELSAGSSALDADFYPITLSGTITYTGSQTGVLHVAALSNGGDRHLTLATTGQGTAYSFSNLISRTDYSISAFIDASADAQWQVWEPAGSYAGNPVTNLVANIENADITLSENTVVDSDGDGLADYDEIYLLGSDPVTFNTTPENVAALTRQVWLNITGTAVSQLTTNALYPYYPDQEHELTSLFEAPVNVANYFGQRILGRFLAPRTGNYTFWLASDDNGELWMTTGTNRQLIANVPGWASSRQWTRYAAQQSVPIYLEAGQVYSIEALGKEHGGGDNLAVGIQFPGGILQRPAGARWFKAPPPEVDLFADSDSDGLTDYEEWVFGSSSSSLDSDSDGISDHDEVVFYGTDPTKIDTDGDGMPDKWEVDNGTNPKVSDAAKDPDGDGLTNLGEYQAGTDPLDADSDNDGVNDYAEVKQVFSNPLVADFDGTVTTDLALAGAEVNDASGAWMRWAGAVESMGRRGSVSFTNIVEVSQDGIYRIEVEGTGERITAANLIGYVDGEYVGTMNLACMTSNQTSSVFFYTQWLQAGAHDLMLYWDNVYSGTKLKILNVKLARLGGPDSNGNGLADWIDNRFTNAATIDSTNLASKVSPACLKGKTAFLDLMTISSDTPIKGCAGNGWYSNVPLNPETQTNVVVNFENGGHSVAANVEWADFNILTESNCQIRAGDSLKLTAVPAGATDGVVSIMINGTNQYTADIATPVVYQFAGSGTYAVTGLWSNDSSIASNTITVKVVAASFSPAGIAAKMGYTRYVTESLIPSSNTVITADSDVQVGAPAVAGAGIRFSLNAPKTDEARYLDVRVAGNTDLILDSVKLDTFWEYHTLDKVFHVLEVLEDGSLLVQNRLVTGYLPASVTLKIQVFISGATLEDGSAANYITNADLNEQGEYIYRLILTPERAAPCHYVKAYQGSEFIGQ